MATYPGRTRHVPPVDTPTNTDRKFARLCAGGYLLVPCCFLQSYAHLKPPLSPGEALFVLHLLEWADDAGTFFPGYRALALRMGVTEKMARRYAKRLEEKAYLRRQLRPGQRSELDISRLFDALLNSPRS